MPKPRKNKCLEYPHFKWRLYQREGIWYADGRSNTPNAGRHSLETSDLLEAKKVLHDLDEQKAEDLGIIPRTSRPTTSSEVLSLADGRKLYEQHINRPAVTGGLQESTKKKYRSHLDKLINFLAAKNISAWNHLTAQLLSDYAAYLKRGGPEDSRPESYSDKSVSNEIVFAKQLVKWFITEGHLAGMQPIELKIRKAESQRPYCWRAIEVAAMINHCRSHKGLNWLGDVIVALACTGLRISELAGLRWADIDLEGGILSLTDERNFGRDGSGHRRLKSGKSRSFPIHANLLQVLRTLSQEVEDIFLGPRGGKLKPDTVRRLLIRDVLTPLADKFPTLIGQRGFQDGRLHSFRHYFCSTCANKGVPDQMLMKWLGHRDSEMVRHYYHLHDAEARQRMNRIDFLGRFADGPHSHQN
ncbi:tyrosine-type recombinase/integrase [Lacipirellula sp.]|uniref:tyrosine-type recombinase/integrase n=1 Tax=Lacipirellula sp. TaxID=2691419 RepID=UPI003D0FA605